MGPGLLLVQPYSRPLTRPNDIDTDRNVGMFRYWTVSNIPLFLLAGPTLFVLFKSGAWGVQFFSQPDVPGEAQKPASWSINSIGYRLAITQIVFAAMAIVGYHVQVITRLCSGCVVWYWWAAVMIADDRKGEWILRWMVMYGLIQGVLFAGFLPPA